MMGAVFAQHVPLIRDYPSAPPPPPAPPAPPQPPQPPQAEPIAFSVVTRASLFGIVGAATGTITLSTVTCADASMTIAVSDAVPGLTFSYAAKVLTVAGTPTGPTMVYRVVVSYVSSDGNSTIRGSSSHEITIVDATEVLTIGNMAGASGRVGIPMTATLASPTTNYSVSVTAAGSNLVPGLSPTLAWTRGASSGSGVLTLAGTPTDTGTYSLTVNFRSDEIALGTSTHAVVIAAAYEAPAPAPAPVAAPTPPAPSPPPAPTPAPAPGLGPDALLAGVRVLMHFNDATGLAFDHAGNTFTNAGAVSTTGAVGEAALFAGPFTTISGNVASLDATATGLAVECMVDIGQTAWSSLVANGSAVRYCPVVSYIAADGSAVWTLGFVSYMNLNQRVVRPIFSNVVIRASYGPTFTYAIGSSAPILQRPNRFVHLCGAREYVGPTSSIFAVWFDGAAGTGVQTTDGPIKTAATGVLKLGGVCAAVDFRVNNSLTEVVAFSGAIDELRVTTGARYTSYIAIPNNSTLPVSERVIPWPNY